MGEAALPRRLLARTVSAARWGAPHPGRDATRPLAWALCGAALGAWASLSVGSPCGRGGLCLEHASLSLAWWTGLGAALLLAAGAAREAARARPAAPGRAARETRRTLDRRAWPVAAALAAVLAAVAADGLAGEVSRCFSRPGRALPVEPVLGTVLAVGLFATAPALLLAVARCTLAAPPPRWAGRAFVVSPLVATLTAPFVLGWSDRLAPFGSGVETAHRLAELAGSVALWGVGVATLELVWTGVRSGARAAMRCRSASCAPEQEPGLSRVDVALAASGAVPVMVATLLLARVALGERRLLALSAAASPVVTSGGQAAAALLGTSLAGAFLITLAAASLSPPTRRLGGAQRLLVLVGGFVATGGVELLRVALTR